MKRTNDERRRDLRLIESADALGRRSLDVLRDIDQTLASIDVDRGLMQSLTSVCRTLEQRLIESPPERRIDAKGKVAAGIRKAAETAAAVHSEALDRRRAAAMDDERLEDDGGVDAYDAFLDAIAEFHDAAEDLAERIAELDADFDAPGETTDASVADVMKGLGLS